MAFMPGDHVHVAALGSGTIREVRNGDRYLVDIKGRSLVASGDQLTRRDAPKKSGPVKVISRPRYEASSSEPLSLDLHGHTVAEALEAVSEFLNGALLSGSSEVRIIHGRSGGKIKSALHAHLGRIASIRAFRLDPRNPGVTIVTL